MFKVERKNKATWVTCKVNIKSEVLKFSPYTLESERSPFTIRQEYGLDADGKFGESFVPFKEDSTEKRLLDFVQSGNVSDLTDAGLVLCDRPSKGDISRNLGVFDPESGKIYFIGGIGLIKPTKDVSHFVLTDPLLNERYGAYQERHGNSAGGTQYFNEQGMTGSVNRSVVGTLEYNTGPYHAVRKALENEKLKQQSRPGGRLASL